MKELTYEMSLNNSGQDIWDYLFENQPLLRVSYSLLENEEWYQEGIDWINGELLDGEVWEPLENERTEVYILTNYGRFANIKRKSFNGIVNNCNSFQGNMSGGAFSVSKVMMEIFNIKLTLSTMHPEAKKHVTIIDCTPSGKKRGRPSKQKE